MRRDHPDQQKLSRFLDHAEELAHPRIHQPPVPLALRLDVGLPATVDLLEHHDLDNYLFPLVGRLGAPKFATVWATKTTATDSWLRIARPVPARVWDDLILIRTTRAAGTAAWKRQVHGQLRTVPALPPGPVELQLLFRVGPGRNWANLWKPTIDSLDAILGRVDSAKGWNPRDGRIVRLGLHHEVVPTLGHDIQIGIIPRLRPDSESF